VKYLSVQFEYLFKRLFDICLHSDYSNADDLNLSRREINHECRKILDFIATKIVVNSFENEKLIDAILKLAKIERIVIVFNMVLFFDLSEIAYMLDASLNSVYVQKSTGLKKLKGLMK
jgi:DNA-directed RNA polymerase specialized sigma24 family protein